MRVGLTGGIGSGKSTVARLLAAKGAVVIDADALAREVVQAGTPGFDAVVAEFGSGVVGADGELNRAAIADVVFADPGARERLNAIVHPLVGQRSLELMTAAPEGAVIVYDIPLLVELNMAAGFDAVIVVEAAPEIRVERLVGRGVEPEQARARMAAQASDEQRRAVATYILDNSGDQTELAAQVEQVWERLSAPAD